MDSSSSSMNMDLNSNTFRLTDALLLVKLVSTRPQSSDISVQPAQRYSTHVFIRRDSLRRPLETAYEGFFKVFQPEPKHYSIYKNGTKDGIGIDRLKAAYLEGNPSQALSFSTVEIHESHYCDTSLDNQQQYIENSTSVF